MKFSIKLLFIVFAIIFTLSLNIAYAETKNNEKSRRIYDPTKSSLQESPYYDVRINSNNIAKYRNNYNLDINLKENSLSPNSVLTDAAMNGISNALFNTQKSIVESIIFMCEKSIQFRSYEIFKYTLTGILKKQFNNTYYIILALLLSIFGIIFLVRYIKNIHKRIKYILMRILIAIILFTLLFIKPISLLSKVDFVMNGISNTVFESIMQYIYINNDNENKIDNNTKNKNMIKLASSIWDQYVHTPWRLMEFGDGELADKAEYQILQYSPNDPSRLEVIKKIEAAKNEYKDYKGYKSQEMATKRLGFILMYFVPLTINFLVVALISILLIGYHFIIVLFTILGVFIFALSIGSRQNISMLHDWVFKIIGTVSTKILLSMGFILILSINNIIYLYTSNSQMGWISSLILQIVLYAMIYWMRTSIIDNLKIHLSLKNKVMLFFPNLLTKNLLPKASKSKVSKIRKPKNGIKLLNESRQLGVKESIPVFDENDKSAILVELFNKNNSESDNNLLKESKSFFDTNRRTSNIWHLEIIYGPQIKVDNLMISTVLILYIDCNTNIVEYAKFYEGNIDKVILSSFKKLTEYIGTPKELNIDSYQYCNSKDLKNLCKKLKCELKKVDYREISKKEYLKKFYIVFRRTFINNLKINKIKDLGDLNFKFNEWLKNNYRDRCSKDLMKNLI